MCGRVFKQDTHGSACVQMCVPTCTAILMWAEKRNKDKEQDEDVVQVLTSEASLGLGIRIRYILD